MKYVNIGNEANACILFEVYFYNIYFSTFGWLVDCRNGLIPPRKLGSAIGSFLE